MALYMYHAFTKEGKKVRGYLDAASQIHVRQQLTKKGLYPLKIEAATPGAQLSWWRRWFARGVTEKDIILFTKQLSVLLKSGVPLLQALELLIAYFEGKFHTILVAVKDDIKEGTTFADALNRYPKIFNTIYVQLVRAGEASGNLEIVLDYLSEFLQKRQEVKKRISAALRQPIIQLSVALIVVVVLLYKVVPTMAEVFKKSGKALPQLTQILLDISSFVVSNLFILLVVIAIVIGLLLYWRTTPTGRLSLDRIKLKLPVIGYFAQMNTVVQFCRTLGLLLQSGVNLAESLDIVVNLIDNKVLSNALMKARDKIVKQGKITEYLRETNVFPPIALYLINTGEESGTLDTMLLTVAQNYEEEMTEYADGLTAKLGPILLIVMALIVGFIVISIALPIVEMADISKIR
jgi:type II secretory pathway component PulF